MFFSFNMQTLSLSYLVGVISRYAFVIIIVFTDSFVFTFVLKLFILLVGSALWK